MISGKNWKLHDGVSDLNHHAAQMSIHSKAVKSFLRKQSGVRRKLDSKKINPRSNEYKRLQAEEKDFTTQYLFHNKWYLLHQDKISQLLNPCSQQHRVLWIHTR